MSDHEPPTPAKTEPMRVFLSYPSQRRDLADHVADQLRKLGIESGDLANSPKPGEEIQSRLRERLKDAKAMIALVTPDSLKSDWLAYEVGLASGLDRRVIPVVVDVDDANLPAALAKATIVKLSDLAEIKKLLSELP